MTYHRMYGRGSFDEMSRIKSSPWDARDLRDKWYTHRLRSVSEEGTLEQGQDGHAWEIKVLPPSKATLTTIRSHLQVVTFWTNLSHEFSANINIFRPSCCWSSRWYWGMVSKEARRGQMVFAVVSLRASKSRSVAEQIEKEPIDLSLLSSQCWR